MGLALAGVACVERRSWVWAGVLLGLAVTSQQVALLVVVPIVVVVPDRVVVAASLGRWSIPARVPPTGHRDVGEGTQCSGARNG